MTDTSTAGREGLFADRDDAEHAADYLARYLNGHHCDPYGSMTVTNPNRFLEHYGHHRRAACDWCYNQAESLGLGTDQAGKAVWHGDCHDWLRAADLLYHPKTVVAEAS